MTKRHVTLGLNTIQRSYPVIARLEQIGGDAWRDAFTPNRDDLVGLEKGTITPRLQKWLDHRKAVDLEIKHQLERGEI